MAKKALGVVEEMSIPYSSILKQIRMLSAATVFIAGLVLSSGYGAAAATAAATPSNAVAGLNNQTPGITVSPPEAELTIGPGLLVAKSYVSITNNTSHDFTGTIRLVDFKALEQSGALSLGQVGVPIAKYGLAGWMSLPAGNSIDIAPGRSSTVEVDVNNRSDLTPGGHYGALVISAAAGPDDVANSVGFNQQLVSLLFLKKLGGEHYGLSLQSLSAGGGGIPDTATIVFKSTGNVYVIPRGYVEVTNPGGKLVAKGIINQNSDLIIQGTSQSLITLLKPLTSSNPSGLYKLTAYYRYQGESSFQSKSIYFNRGGWSPIFIVAVGATGVIILLLLHVIHRKESKKVTF